GGLRRVGGGADGAAILKARRVRHVGDDKHLRGAVLKARDRHRENVTLLHAVRVVQIVDRAGEGPEGSDPKPSDAELRSKDDGERGGARRGEERVAIELAARAPELRNAAERRRGGIAQN